MKHFESYVAKLRSKFPPEVNQKMLEFEGRNEYQNPEYIGLTIQYFYARHLCLTDPLPEPIGRSFNPMYQLNNDEICQHLQGRSQMSCTGVLKDWDVTGRLHKIQIETLILAGENDSMNPEEMRLACDKMPNARIVMSKTGSHMAMYDAQREYFAALLDFLDEK